MAKNIFAKSFSVFPEAISHKGLLFSLLLLLGIPALVLGVQQATNNQQFASGGKACHDHGGSCLRGSLCQYLKGTGYECSYSYNDCGIGNGCKVKTPAPKSCSSVNGQCVRPDQCNIQGYSCNNNYTGCIDRARCRIKLDPPPQPKPSYKPGPSCASQGGRCVVSCPSGDNCPGPYDCGVHQTCAISQAPSCQIGSSYTCYGIQGYSCGCYAKPYWTSGHNVCPRATHQQEVVHNTKSGWWYCLGWK